MIGLEGAGLAVRPEDGFAEAVVRGLSSRRKAISPKWLYDARGSALYELICEQPEYYPPRIETALAIARRLTPTCVSCLSARL